MKDRGHLHSWFLLGVAFLVCLPLAMFGCSDQPSRVEIGSILPLTGSQANYGQSIQQGINLAVRQANENGGIRGDSIEVIYEDYQGEPDKAVSAARKLINVNDIESIIGAFSSSATLAVAPVAERNQVVLLSPSASTPKLSTAGDYIFRNEISEDYGAEKSAELYYEQGFQEIAILYVNNDYGVAVRDVTTQVYDSLDGTITAAESFAREATDFRTQLTKIRESNPEAILIAGYKEMIPILRQITELGIDKQILSTPLFEDPEIIQEVGSAANGVIYSYYGSYKPQGGREAVRRFVNSYQKKYGSEPGYYAALAYDAAKILIRAARSAGSYEAEPIKEALYKIEDYPGVTGSTSFDKNGDVVKPVTLKTVVKGEFVFLESK